jgi:hypothetical protein
MILKSLNRGRVPVPQLTAGAPFPEAIKRADKDSMIKILHKMPQCVKALFRGFYARFLAQFSSRGDSPDASLFMG